MKGTKILTILLAISLVACRNKSEDLKRGQQQYDVVEEGSASGVSSTINPLNESQPTPTAAMTGTNVDTTTNFTLPNTMPPMTSTDPGSVASTLPPAYDTTPRPAPRPRPAERAPEPAPMASSTPENTDTMTPPPATNTTTAQTDTSTDPARHVEGENKSEEKKNETPPPPPPTDTMG
jgi:hypothetical protein